MNKSIALYILTLIAFSGYAQTIYNLEDDLFYKDIKGVTNKILEACPTNNCHVVGIGRSPTSITTFLQSLNPELASNLPLSGFRHNANNPEPFIKGRGMLAPEFEKKLFTMFDELVEKAGTKNKKLLFIDYSVTGRSAYAVQSYFEKYLEDKGIKDLKTKTIIMAVSESSGQDMLRNASVYKLKTTPSFISLAKYEELLDAMHHSYTDSYAKYQSHYIEKDPLPKLNATSERRKFEKFIEGRILADNNLKNLEVQLCFKQFKRKQHSPSGGILSKLLNKLKIQ